MKYVIIGGSIAGISAAGSIRKKDGEADIVMISDEKGKAYYRPMIPFLIEDPGREIEFTEDPAEQYDIRKVRALAEAIDTESRKVRLSSGGPVAYDRLLISTGSRAVIPPVEGLEGAGSFALRTREDAERIRTYGQGKKAAVIIGGGLVGIKAAAALAALGLNVTIVEQLDRLLSGRLDSRGADIIQRVLGENGFSIRTGETAQKVVRRGESVKGVILASGELLDADLIVSAAGVEPNISFLAGSGIAVGRGILVDERLETNVPGVYAAGDVVEYTDAVTGRNVVSALWTSAEEMGRFAGTNMAGGSTRYRGFLSTMNATEILGVPFISVGVIEPEEEGFDVIVDDRIGSYRKLVFDGDVLSGFIFLGDVTGAGIYTNLVRNRIAIGELKEEAIMGRLEYIDFLRPAEIPASVI